MSPEEFKEQYSHILDGINVLEVNISQLLLIEEEQELKIDLSKRLISLKKSLKTHEFQKKHFEENHAEFLV